MSNSTSYPSPNHTGYAGLLGYTSYIPHPESLFDQACFIVCLGSKKNAFQLGLKILQILARMGIYKPQTCGPLLNSGGGGNPVIRSYRFPVRLVLRSEGFFQSSNWICCSGGDSVTLIGLESENADFTLD
jgi:hypothetical protein